MNSQGLASGERQEPLIIPGSIDNNVIGMDERRQQRGSLKDEVYIVNTLILAALI
ncbi:hypothetical protein Xmau_01595 [Xenorhabdus mauleonii]|uniref:Uncharacterized protein n=1 Tax=Xenorhabdus mauleonii TaxID=351675 RepID=A0A1I3P987_9GAMM|nr:hypothetical protein Xmau_01595 [Xenorhabdus mauleonii]SFJ17887.1 hypothetical protein SAMN05421680_10666 [Xenorhabdus mauleonii]